jgi:hypothetical protein
LLDALGATPGNWELPPAAFTAALATVLGAERGKLTSRHSQLLVQLYFATGGGRQDSAPDPVLRLRLGFDEQSRDSQNALDDKFHELLRPLQALQLIQMGRGLRIGWTALTLEHLPPGQTAKDPTFRDFL